MTAITVGPTRGTSARSIFYSGYGETFLVLISGRHVSKYKALPEQLPVSRIGVKNDLLDIEDEFSITVSTKFCTIVPIRSILLLSGMRK